MKEKLLAMVGSIRFWYVIITAIIYFLEVHGIVSNEVLTIVSGICGTGVLIRTIDKVAK